MGAYISLVLVLTAQPPARVTVGQSFTVSVLVTNMYNSSTGSCDPPAPATTFSPTWDYSHTPGLEFLSLVETTTNATSGVKQTHQLSKENITATANSTNYRYQSTFQLYQDARNTIQVDFEVMVSSNITQGTLHHNISIPLPAFACVQANTTSTYLVQFSQTVACAGKGKQFVEGEGCVAVSVSSASSLRAALWSLFNKLSV